MHKLVYLYTLLIAFFTNGLHAQHDLEPLAKSLTRQARYQTLSATITQTKEIPALTEPIITKGQLWLKPGKSFRWQLGKPKSSTAIYNGEMIYLLDELRMEGASYPPSDKKVKPLLLMLGMGDGASLDKLKKSFQVTGVGRKKEHYVAAFVPKSGKLKRALKSLVIQVNLKTSSMERIQWTQKDGSVVTTTFTKLQINSPLPKGIFSFDKNQYRWK